MQSALSTGVQIKANEDYLRGACPVLHYGPQVFLLFDSPHAREIAAHDAAGKLSGEGPLSW